MIEPGRLRRPKGSGSVRPRADGRWQGRVTVGGRRHTVYGRTEAEAEQRVAALRAGHVPAYRSAPRPHRATAHDFTVRALEDAAQRGLNLSDTARLVLAAIRPGRLERGIYGPCAYCGDIYATSVDHVIPVARGGTDTVDNVVSACVRCNGRKGDRTPEEWRQLP